MAFSSKQFLFFQFFITFFYYSLSGVTLFIELECLIKEVRRRTIWDVGPSKLVGFYNPTKVTENYFAALDQILPHNNNFPVVIKDGFTIPQLVINWLCNIQSPEQIRLYALEELKKLEATTGHSTKLYQAIADHMFTPHRYAKARDCESEGAKIIKAIYNQLDHYGNRKHKIYIVTNQNNESFHELCKNKEIKAIVDLCDGIITSGDAHKLKPDPAFFEYAFKKIGIDDTQLLIYIDVEINFIIAAQNLGRKNLYCIHCKDYNYKPVRQALIQYGVIA